MSNGFYFNQPGDRVAGTPTVQTGTAQIGYEATYLTDFSDENIQRPALLNETSGAWQIAFGGNQRIDLIVLQHNFDSGLVCDFRGGGTFGAPTLTAPFAVPAKRADDFAYKLWIDLRVVSGYTASGFSTWWLKVTGVNSVPVGAKLWLGTIIRSLSRNFAYPSHPETDTPASISLSTDAGPVWGYDLTANPRQFTGTQNYALTDVSALRDWQRASGGRAKLSLMIPDATKQDAWFVRWVNGVTRDGQGVVKPLFDPSMIAPSVYTVSVTLDEVTAGSPEWS